MWKRAAKIFTTDGNYTVQLESLASAGPKRKRGRNLQKGPCLCLFTRTTTYMSTIKPWPETP